MCKEKAKKIWEMLGENDRSNAATTIAVVHCTDGKYYCTSNDVSAISTRAIKKAEELGITPIENDYISQAGAGFHAEMWAVIQAMHTDAKIISEVLSKVGASRACCKNCSDVLKILKVPVEEESNTVYKSWYNPMTVGEKCTPRQNFKDNQYKHIPDFRNNSKDYWFTDRNGAFQITPPDSAK